MAGTQVLETIGSSLGAHLHVKGGGSTQFISINTYDVPVISVFLAGGWPGLCPCGTESCPELSGHPERVICWSQGLQSASTCLLFVLWIYPPPPPPPPRRKTARPNSHCISLLWMCLPRSQPLGRAHNFNPPCAKGEGGDTWGYKTSYVHRVLGRTPPQACTCLGTVGAGVELRWMVWM